MDCWGNKHLYKNFKRDIKNGTIFSFLVNLNIFFIVKKVYNLVKNEKSEYCLR